VIAETGERQGAEPGLSRTRPLALAASGSTGIVSAATTPMALVSTTPRSPALRWVPGPQAAAPAPRTDYAQRQETREPRPVPPANVRYTNALATPAAAEPDQPLPAAPPAKVEQRLATTPAATQRVAEPPAAKAAPALQPREEASKPAATPATTLATPAAARSGWVIQLAAADSEGKARSILDQARKKTGRLLGTASPFTEPVAKGASTLFRARFAGFDADEAQNACKALKRNGFNCFAQKI
jgi:D-alanyl-D-alanine carboxypeptidase